MGIHLEFIFNKIYNSNKFSCRFPRPQEIRNISIEKRKTAAIRTAAGTEEMRSDSQKKRGNQNLHIKIKDTQHLWAI